MSDWQRSTEERTYGDLAPEVQSSIADYAEKHRLGDIGAAATFCAVTSSERKKLFGKRSQTTSIVVTPDLLVWSLSEHGDITTIAARRSEVEISEFRVGACRRLRPRGLRLRAARRVRARHGVHRARLGARSPETPRSPVPGALGLQP